MDLNEPNAITLNDWRRSLRARNRSVTTIQSYLESGQQLAAFHPGRDLLELSRGDIEAYIGDLLSRLSASTAAVRYRSLDQLYKWAMGEGLVEVSPMAGMKVPTVPEKPVPIIPDDQIRLLLRACEGTGFAERRDTAIIRLFLEPGGLRLSEMTNLKVADVDLDYDAVVVLGKGKKPRTVPFGNNTGQAISRYLRVRHRHPVAASPALWLGSRGMPMTPSGIAQMVKRRQKQAGIPHIHPHMFRHTAAHNWLASGGSGGDSQRLFGWKDPAMLNRYGASGADARAQKSARDMAMGDRF